MKTKIFLVSAFLIIAFFSIIFFVKKNNSALDDPVREVCFKEKCFLVELALTPETQSLGLMYRDSLDPNRGMLFIFKENGIHPFWMKNTKIPLDIIWISKNREVVYIKNNAKPCEEEVCPEIYSDKEARYVLEINAGLSAAADLAVGDKLTFKK